MWTYRSFCELQSRQIKRVLVRALACSLLFSLPSCHIVPLRPAEVAPPVPASYDGTTNVENSAHLDYREFYQDPLLVCLLDQAIANNRELKILNEEIQIAANEVLARRGAYLPFVNFGAGAGLAKPSLFTPQGAVEDQLQYLPGKNFPNPLPTFNTGFNLFWQLDIWRELRNARDAASQRFLAAIERRNAFVTRLVAEIAENYYRLMALDKRIETLNNIIELQEQSLKSSIAKKEAGRGTELAVQRFQAEVRKNQSEKLIVRQEIIEVENRINFLVNRFPQPVERAREGFFDLTIHSLSLGLPAQLLQNRPDIRQAERELEAAGLDIKVARAHFFPRLDLSAGVGYEAFNLKYLFNTPDSLIYNVAGNLTAPVINFKAIQAEYMSANARQLECVYNYQRVILNAFTEVVNRISMVENYRKSMEIKRQQLKALDDSVDTATKLFLNARAEYMDVLFSQRDLLEATTVLIDTKKQQLSAIVNTYQALGGGDFFTLNKVFPPGPMPVPPGGAAPVQPDKLQLPQPQEKKGVGPALPQANPQPQDKAGALLPLNNLPRLEKP